MAQEEDEQPGVVLEIEAEGPDGRAMTIRAVLLDGPLPCPFCPEGFSIYAREDGEDGFMMHPAPICDPFRRLTAEDYMARVHADAAGVNVRGRGSA